MFNTISLQLTGVQALLVNSPETINPFSPATIAIAELTGKRKRTEAENLQLFRLKWQASLYLDAEKGPCLPANNILRSVQAAAALSRQGKNIERGVTVRESLVPIEYDGPRTPQAMWDDKRFVDVRDGKVSSGSRIPVVRPIFPVGWKCAVTFDLAPDVVSVADFLMHAVQAGRLIGVGTYRAKFGRFTLGLISASDAKDARKACEAYGVEILPGFDARKAA